MSPAKPSPAKSEVLERLHSLVTCFHRHMHEAVRDDGDGLALMEARALNFLARHEGSSQRELVLHAGRDKAQIARIVKTLHERGLLDSAPDPQDGRCQRLRLTPEGHTMHRRMQQHRMRFEQALTRGFDAAELAALQAQLERMQANVEKP